MNKVDIRDYIKKEWDVSGIVVEPSQDLVKKWLNVLQYKSEHWQPIENTDDTYAMAHNYMYHNLDVGRPLHLLPLDEKDYLEVAINLEYLEQCIIKNTPKSEYQNGKNYSKWAIPDYRSKLSGVEFSDEEMQLKIISKIEHDIKWTTQDIKTQEMTLENLKYKLERLKVDYEKNTNIRR